MFSHKPANVLAKTRAFTPLASQQWVTVALAYIKELDVIFAKRLELTSQTKQNPFAATSSADTPKPKQTAKKKGKGGGKANAAANTGEPED